VPAVAARRRDEPVCQRRAQRGEDHERAHWERDERESSHEARFGVIAGTRER
jgi:hypothetical protein